MGYLDGIRYRLSALFRRGLHEREIGAEVRFHLDLETMQRKHAGLDSESAELAARKRFGNVTGFREEIRRASGVERFDGIRRNLRYAVRTLGRHPGFALVAVVTLGLGVGGAAAIGALVYTVLVRPLPYPNSDRLVSIDHSARGVASLGLSDGLYLHYTARNRAFEAIGGYQENDGVALTDRDQPERVRVALVTPSVFAMLGVKPELGRLFAPTEGVSGGRRIVTISHALWAGRYGADRSVLGRTIELNRTQFEVIGVMPAGFDFPRPGTQVWYNIGINAAEATTLGFQFQGIGRLREGMTPRDGADDLRRLLGTLEGTLPDATRTRLRDSELHPLVAPLKDLVVRDVREPLVILLSTALFVLLIAWANVANLVLIRAERQRHEIAVERALGASRADVIRRVSSEMLVLSALGSLLGFGLGSAGVAALLRYLGDQMPRLPSIETAGAVAALVTVFSLASCCLLGLVALARIGNWQIGAAIRAGSTRLTSGLDWRRIQGGLVAGQVALALTLLIGSAVMVESLWRLRAIDLGFDPRGTLTLQLDLPYGPYHTYQTGARFYRDALERIRAIPGLTAAEAVAFPPVSSEATMTLPIEAEGVATPSRGALPRSLVNMATPGYFAAMRIPLVTGRVFEPGDLSTEIPSIVVSAELAKRVFAGESALGRRIRIANDSTSPWLSIVGVVGSVPGETIAGGQANAIYLPVLEPWAGDPNAGSRSPIYPGYMTIVVKTALPGRALISALRRAIREVDPKVPVAAVGSMEQIVERSTARLRFTMLLLMVASGAALLLGAIGVYGVISYAVAQRAREFGIRLALGARASELEAMVVRQGATVATFGIAVGIVTALGLTRFLRGLLFDVSPSDPIAFATMAGLVFAIAIVATYIPARRARGIDPANVLRSE